MLDEWHNQLGNINELGTHELLDEFKSIDFIGDIMDGKTGRVAFYSIADGEVSYMAYASVPDTDFSLALLVQDDVVFDQLIELKETLTYVGIVEVVLLLMFILCIYYIMRKSVKSEARVKEAELALLQQKDKELQGQFEAAADRQGFLEAMAINFPGGYHRCSTDNGFRLSFVSNTLK